MTVTLDYEEANVLSEYLSFHYRGDREDYLPLHPLPSAVLGYPRRCAEAVFSHRKASQRNRVLDLGCAVGRSTFELSAEFSDVLGIDLSRSFIEAACQLRDSGTLRWSEKQTCGSSEERTAQVRSPWHPERVTFEVGDACALRPDLGTFDAILMANLLCRLPDPAACLGDVARMLNPDGILVLTTPMSWSDACTPPDRWVNESQLASCLPGLSLIEEGELPFVLREHARKAQFTVAKLTVWQRV